METNGSAIRDALVVHGAPPATADVNSQSYVQAFTSGILVGSNDDIERVTGPAPLSFSEFAVSAAAAWRR